MTDRVKTVGADAEKEGEGKQEKRMSSLYVCVNPDRTISESPQIGSSGTPSLEGQSCGDSTICRSMHSGPTESVWGIVRWGVPPGQEHVDGRQVHKRPVVVWRRWARRVGKIVPVGPWTLPKEGAPDFDGQTM